jgi:hypothetical protein
VAIRLYGHREHAYCEPFAEALAEVAAFRMWVLQRVGLDEFVASARCMREEQRAKRPTARFWWKNYYCHERRCICPALAGREIDVLAIFQDSGNRTIGLHVECKRPGDTFSAEQAKGYRVRAECWSRQTRNPPTVLPHDLAKTVLICERRDAHADFDLKAFDEVIYFDEIRERIAGFPAGEAP